MERTNTTLSCTSLWVPAMTLVTRTALHPVPAPSPNFLCLRASNQPKWAWRERYTHRAPDTFLLLCNGGVSYIYALDILLLISKSFYRFVTLYLWGGGDERYKVNALRPSSPLLRAIGMGGVGPENQEFFRPCHFDGSSPSNGPWNGFDGIKKIIMSRAL